jgi:hypothetical protein
MSALETWVGSHLAPQLGPLQEHIDATVSNDDMDIVTNSITKTALNTSSRLSSMPPLLKRTSSSSVGKGLQQIKLIEKDFNTPLRSTGGLTTARLSSSSYSTSTSVFRPPHFTPRTTTFSRDTERSSKGLSGRLSALRDIYINVSQSTGLPSVEPRTDKSALTSSKRMESANAFRSKIELRLKTISRISASVSASAFDILRLEDTIRSPVSPAPPLSSGDGTSTGVGETDASGNIIEEWNTDTSQSLKRVLSLIHAIQGLGESLSPNLEQQIEAMTLLRETLSLLADPLPLPHPALPVYSRRPVLRRRSGIAAVIRNFAPSYHRSP